MGLIPRAISISSCHSVLRHGAALSSSGNRSGRQMQPFSSFRLYITRPPYSNVKDLHARQRPVHEDERLAVMHVPPHLVRHDAAQGVEALAHVRGVRIQVERIRLAQAEHGHQRKRVTNWRN